METRSYLPMAILGAIEREDRDPYERAPKPGRKEPTRDYFPSLLLGL